MIFLFLDVIISKKHWEVISIKTKKIFKILIFLLVIFTIISPIFLNGYGAYSMIVQSNRNLANNPDLVAYQVNLMDTWKSYGGLMIFSSILMVLSTILCVLSFDIIPMITQTIGFTICMILMFKMSAIADKFGLTDSSLQPLSQKYFNRHIITVVPFLLLIVICLCRFFSYEKKSKRNKKRLDKINKENAPCEKIVD